MTIGERIRERRRELRMTQNDLAQAVGVTYQLISNYEHSVVSDIPTSRVKQMARVLQCDPFWLMEGVFPQEGLTASQIRCIEMIKAATPEQMAKIESIITLVMQ